MHSLANDLQRSAKRLAVALAIGLQLVPNPAFAAELLMFERQGCLWCDEWHKVIGPIYPKTEEGAIAPLRAINIAHVPDSVVLASPVIFTPTFVVVDNNKEVGRITGYPGADFFWGLLSGILVKVATK